MAGSEKNKILSDAVTAFFWIASVPAAIVATFYGLHLL